MRRRLWRLRGLRRRLMPPATATETCRFRRAIAAALRIIPIDRRVRDTSADPSCRGYGFRTIPPSAARSPR
ncbi:hypothetical protein [Lysobacter gummosus]|uniref:hypothetical protein n=1 Tax=Lysobacter gummosus TaxID=262324 RepID=UPI0036434F50